MDDWVTAPLAEVLEFREGPGIMAADFRDAGVPLVRLAGLKSGADILEGCNFLDAEMVARKWDHFRLRRGDVLLSTSASLGEVATVNGRGVGAVPYTGIIAFRPSGSEVDASLIPHLLTAPIFKAQIEAMGVGSVMKHFGPSHLRKMFVTYPRSRRVQVAIARVLGALADKIAANDRVAIAALALAQTIYQRDTASASATPMLSEVEPILGGTPSRADSTLWRGSNPWLSVKDVTAAPHGIVAETVEHISDAALGPARLRPLPAGSVVLSARGTVGRVATLEIAASINQSCYGFLPSNIPAACLRFAIEGVVADARALAHGSVFDTLTMRSFEHLTLPDRTHEAWRETERAISPMTAVAAQAVRESLSLAATRDELLPLLMTGKVTVGDLPDELTEVATR